MLFPHDSAIQVIGFVPQLHSHFFMFCLSNAHISSYCDYFVAPSVQSGNIYTSFDNKWSLKVWYVGSFHYIAGLSIWNWKLRHSVGLICRNFVKLCNWVVWLQNKGEEVTSDLNGRCVFLVGEYIFWELSSMTALEVFVWLNSVECETQGWWAAEKQQWAKFYLKH